MLNNPQADALMLPYSSLKEKPFLPVSNEIYPTLLIQSFHCLADHSRIVWPSVGEHSGIKIYREKGLSLALYPRADGKSARGGE